MSDATPTPIPRRLKTEARQLARSLGHTLGRFASSEPEHGEPYALARCQACLLACAVVSPTRYGPRTMGGSALRDACPTPFLTDAANLVDQPVDDDDAEISEPVLRTDAEEA